MEGENDLHSHRTYELEYIYITAYWGSKGGGQCFTKESLKVATKHIILSCYFKVGVIQTDYWYAHGH